MDLFFSCIPGIDQPQPVPVLEARTLQKEVFEKEWVARNRACLVKGAVQHWPAVEKWRHKEYWLEKCDDFEIGVYPHQNFNDHEKQQTGRENMHFHAAIERLFAGSDPVFSMPTEEITNEGRFYRIKEDMAGFTFLPDPAPPRYYERFRFFTYRRAATGWHYHGVDETLMCQVNGAKRVVLLSPHIPKPAYVTNFLQHEHYLDGKVLEVPSGIQPMMVDVEEGDALYIPPYWHHVVVPVDGEIGFTVACCWKSPLHILGNFSNFFVRALYKQGMRPFGLNTILLPFLGCYAALLYTARKISGKV